MEPIIHNLDERKRPPEFINMGGHKVDITFIPAGIAIPLLKAYDDWAAFSRETGIDKLQENTQLAFENTQMQADILAMFTSYKNDELTKDWLLHNLTLEQIAFCVVKLIKTITGNYSEKSVENKKKEILNGKES